MTLTPVQASSAMGTNHYQLGASPLHARDELAMNPWEKFKPFFIVFFLGVATVFGVSRLVLFSCSTRRASPQISKTSLLLVVQHPPSVCRLRPPCLCDPAHPWTIDHLWPNRFAPPWPCNCSTGHCPEVHIVVQAENSTNVCNLWPDIICNQCCRNWIYNEWPTVANCLFSDPIFSQDSVSEVAHHYFELAEELFLQAKITERLEENNITPSSTASYTVEQFQNALKPEVILGCQTIPNSQCHFVTRIGICFDCDSLSNSCKQIACHKKESEPVPWSRAAGALFLNGTERDIHCPQNGDPILYPLKSGSSPCCHVCPPRPCPQEDSVTDPLNTDGLSLCDYSVI